VQIGTAEDEHKPTFASLRPGQSMHTITLEEALKLFTLPRKLGELDGKELTVAIGRFGPFAKRGDTYASLGTEDDPYVITYERAAELIRAREELIANRLIKVFDDSPIQVLNGKYGAYITDGEKNGKIPKDRDPKSLTREECEAILLAAPVRPQRGRFGKKAPAKKAARKVAAKKTNGEAADAGAGKAPAKKAVKKATRKATKKVAKKAPAKKAAAKSATGAPVKKAAAKKAPAKKAAKRAAAKAPAKKVAASKKAPATTRSFA
jgi:DNA topoisomerase-1